MGTAGHIMANTRAHYRGGIAGHITWGAAGHIMGHSRKHYMDVQQGTLQGGSRAHYGAQQVTLHAIRQHIMGHSRTHFREGGSRTHYGGHSWAYYMGVEGTLWGTAGHIAWGKSAYIRLCVNHLLC